MGWRIYSVVAGLLISQQVAAADQSRSERDRQISEIVFQNYPPRAFAAGEEGPVFFTVTLDKDAHPTSCQVTHGSGHPLLDDETCKLIVQLAVFNSAKDANGRLIRQTTEGVVNWTLPGHTPAPINFSPAASAAPATTERQVCKKTLRVGTLSDYERTCMTPSEWAHQSDEEKQTYEELQGRRGSTHCTIAIGGMGTGTAGSGAAEEHPDC
jgi:TonB family protein